MADLMDPRIKLLLAAAWKRIGSAANLLQRVLDMEISYLGYTERSDGWSMFGQWYADNIAHQQSFAYDDWCAMFQTYCMVHCGVPATMWPRTSPQGSAVSYLAAWLADRGFEIQRSAMPAKFDIILYSWTSDPSSLDHVGMVQGVTGQTPNTAILNVIEGNKGGAVGYRQIAWTDTQIARVFRLHN